MTYNELLGLAFIEFSLIVILVFVVVTLGLRLRHCKRQWRELPANREYYSTDSSEED